MLLSHACISFLIPVDHLRRIVVGILRYLDLEAWSHGHWAKENSGVRGQSSHYPDPGDMDTFIRVLEAVTCRSGEIRRVTTCGRQWTVDTPGYYKMTQFDTRPDRM